MSTKDTLALAEACGLTVEKGSRHYKLKTPDGRLAAVVPYGKPRDAGKQQKNVEAAIKRAGRSIEDGSTTEA